jgi:hypothetical protein
MASIYRAAHQTYAVLIFVSPTGILFFILVQVFPCSVIMTRKQYICSLVHMVKWLTFYMKPTTFDFFCMNN